MTRFLGLVTFEPVNFNQIDKRLEKLCRRIIFTIRLPSPKGYIYHVLTSKGAINASNKSNCILLSMHEFIEKIKLCLSKADILEIEMKNITLSKLRNNNYRLSINLTHKK